MILYRVSPKISPLLTYAELDYCCILWLLHEGVVGDPEETILEILTCRGTIFRIKPRGRLRGLERKGEGDANSLLSLS